MSTRISIDEVVEAIEQGRRNPELGEVLVFVVPISKYELMECDMSNETIYNECRHALETKLKECLST